MTIQHTARASLSSVLHYTCLLSAFVDTILKQTSHIEQVPLFKPSRNCFVLLKQLECPLQNIGTPSYPTPAIQGKKEEMVHYHSHQTSAFTDAKHAVCCKDEPS